MALYKLSKVKVFHVHYCGCTAASLLSNEQIIRDSITRVRQGKTKQDFVRTTISISSDGIKLTYENEKKLSTHVPSTMIASSAIGKSSFQDSVGVIYISPLTGEHYPAFVHIYRCDSVRTAQKLLSRLRAYLLIDSHHNRLVQLEKELLSHHLLSLNTFNGVKSLTNSGNQVETSSPSNDLIQKEKRVDPIKSITEELQRKIQSNEPILFPPKDYDTVHANHGHVKRAQAWKSTEPAIVGYSPINGDDNRARPQTSTSTPTANSHLMSNAHLKLNEFNEIDSDRRLRLASHRSDATTDPVETVSLAFDFLKDETGSILNENDGRLGRLESNKNNDMQVYHFRAPQATAISTNWLVRNNQGESSHLPQQVSSSSKTEYSAYYAQKPRELPKESRTRSETRLLDDYQPGLHLKARYGSGAPISPNPVWSGHLPSAAGSQPNLLSVENSSRVKQSHIEMNRADDRLAPPSHIQHPLYVSHPDEKFLAAKMQNIPNGGRRQEQRRNQLAQSQYLDTHEFILRPSNDQTLRQAQNPARYMPTALVANRPHSMNINTHMSSMLDVYY